MHHVAVLDVGYALASTWTSIWEMMPLPLVVALAVMACAGCNLLLPLSPARDLPVLNGVTPTEFGAPDSSGNEAFVGLESGPKDGPGGDVGCTTTAMIPLTAVADACLISEIPYGKDTVCNIGVGINSRGIFRFDMSALPAEAKIQQMKLSLGYAAIDTACGATSTCVSCDSIEKAGTLQLAYMTSTWVEAQTTWTLAKTGVAWDKPGASGASDLGTPVAAVAHTPKQAVVFDSSANSAMLTQLDTWKLNKQISLQVIPTNGAVFIAATRESGSKGCSAYSKPSLEISYCP